MALQGKPNVTVLPQTHSKRLLVEQHGDSLKCVGVEVILPTGECKSFRAKRETIVSSGVFESPKLLMLSGIGPKEELSKFNIPVKVESPNVGRNLLDHPIMPHVFRIKEGTGLDGHLLRPGLAKDAAIEAYRTKKSGPLASPLLEMVGLPRIDERLEKYPEYRAAKAANGGKDPFGPDGQVSPPK
jgi:choline dehydrogenase